MRKKLCFLISLVLVVGLNGTALADAIEVNNPSFEYDINGVQITELTGWDAVKGWVMRDTTGWAAGWQFVDDEWWGEGYEAADGNVCSFNVTGDDLADQNYSCQIVQVLADPNAVIAAGYRYTLTFNALRLGTDDNPTAYGALFYNTGDINAPLDDTILAEKEATLTAAPWGAGGYAGWEEVSLYYVALPGAGSLGETLGIKLSVPVHDPWLDGYQVVLDNVRVDYVEATAAFEPYPDDEARDVPKNVTLGWKAGVKTQPTGGHMVYFGTDETAVDDATTNSPEYKTTRDVNNWSPGTLELGRTYYWRVDEVNDSEGGSPWKGDVWSFEVTGYATNPSPADGAIDVPFLNQSLSWTAGTEATSHDVYLGTDQTAVANATTSSSEYKGNQGGTTYPLTGLMVGETYYWRIDERSAVHPTGLKGDIWRFTVGNFLIVDNFDSYNNNSELYAVWDDYWVNGSDAEIYLGTTIVRQGKSMDFTFTNTSTYKENKVTYYTGSWADVQDMTEVEIGSDWTIGGVKAITVWVRGDPCNGPYAMVGGKAPDLGIIRPWVELEDTSSNVGIVLYDDANDLTYARWNEWNIDLGIFDACGVTLSAIDRFTFGIGGRKGGQTSAPDTKAASNGQAYVEDIRLYPPRCFPALAQQAGNFNGDCVVDEFDLDVLVTDWLVSDYNTEAAPPASPPEVWYRFDEGSGSTVVRNSGSWGSQYDISISSPNAVNEPSWTTDVAPAIDVCDPNYALDFDGKAWDNNGDCLKIPSVATNFAGTQNMTIATWIKPDTAMAEWDWPSLVESRRVSGDTTEASGFGFGSWGELIYWWNDVYWDWHCDLWPATGAWSFAAVAVEPTQATIYLSDGANVDSATHTATHDALTDWDTGWTNLIAGNTVTSRHAYFNGKIDDVRLYNKTLTIGEIMGLCGISGEVYVPNNSKANIAPKIPPPTNYDPNDPDIVNFEDYDVLADNWLDEILWP